MAFGLILWILPVFVEVCFGNNTSTYHGSSPSLSSIRPSGSLARPNFNTSTILVPTPSTGFASTLHSNLTNTSTILGPSIVFQSPLRSNLTISTSSVLQSLPTLLSTLYFNLTVNSASSVVASLRNGTIFRSNGSFKNEKSTTILQTATVISSALPALLRNFSQSGSIFVPSSLSQFRVFHKTKSVNGSSVLVNSSFVSNFSTKTLVSYGQESSAMHFSSSVGVPVQGSNKIFVAELRILNMNFTSELKNKNSSLFRKTALTIISSIDSVMAAEHYYKGCQVIEIRTNSGIIKLEVKMGPGSSSDPKITLGPLETAVRSGSVGKLTVDSIYFTRWLKKDPPPREMLLSGQLAGAALILFILVVLLLIICLGNFVDQPVFNERELFTEEVSMENLGRDRDKQGTEDEEWKFDPLFAWSPRKSYDSKL